MTALAYRHSRWVMGVFVLFAAALLAFATLHARAAPVSGSLTTFFDANNGNFGNTFDLEVLPRGGVVVESLDVNVVDEGDTGPIQVWTRPGTSVGFGESEAGWTSRGSVEVTSEGENNPTPVPLSFSLPQGSYGVAIGVPGSGPDLGVRYTDLDEDPPTTFEDEALRLIARNGLGEPIFNGGGVSGTRIWNGTIHYSTPSCEFAKKKLKKAKKQAKKAKQKLAEAEASGNAAQIDRAEQKLEKKNKKRKKAKRVKKRACA